MTKWKHDYEISAEWPFPTRILDLRGEEGWELCSIVRGDEYHYAYFKRQAGPIERVMVGTDLLRPAFGEAGLAGTCQQAREEVNAERLCGCGGSDKLGHGDNCKGWPWSDGSVS